MRLASRFVGGRVGDRALAQAALMLFSLSLALPDSLGQDNSGGEENGEKKHYLTFQLSYFGSAHRAHQDEFGQNETSIEVNDRFSGRIEVHPTESRDLPKSAEAQFELAAAIQAAVLAGDEEKLKALTPPSFVTWYSVGSEAMITGTIAETETSSASKVEQGESRASSDHGTQSYQGQKEFEASFSASVIIRPESKTYDLELSLRPDMATTWEAVHQTLVSDHTEEGRVEHKGSEADVPLDMGPGQMDLGYSNYQIVAEVKGQPLAGDANELIGTTRIPVPKPAGWDGAWDIGLNVSWQIDVTLPPVELIITAPGYDEWRPEGNIKQPTEPGNKLLARATLKPKDGGTGDFIPRVKHIRFELLDTSREPGVCLNWPLIAKDTDLDMRFVVVSEGTLSNSDQTLAVSDPRRNDDGQPYAEVQIDSYDFGGRSSLRAVCLLADGREIEGVMQDVGEMPRLPKMKGPGWIADSWRKKHEVMKLADDDDEEKVEGQPLHGDGFTLYEEYRGWVEKGKHIEGDPKKKDFFVLNKIGADAKGGLALFERVSKLRTHSDLRTTEILVLGVETIESEANSKGERIMNFNHRDAPHRVDQHGVYMINTSGFRSSGAATNKVYNDDKKNRAFRPGKVQSIRVEERARADGIFSKQASTTDYNLSDRDAAFAYDRGVAHELLHAVGVDHHGEGEEAHTFYFQGAGDPMNPTHRARFVQRMPSSDSDFSSKVFGQPAVWSNFDSGPTITLRWEDTGEDVAQSMSTEFESELAAERENPIYDHGGGERAAKYPQYGKDAHFWSEMSIYNAVTDGRTRHGAVDGTGKKFDRWVTIGRDHQADSGNELCLMRYYFANAYPMDAQEKAFYLVRPGMNRAGRDLCKGPEGTGANAPGHPPKSRFGDSAPGRGGCFKYICPNDAIPPREL